MPSSDIFCRVFLSQFLSLAFLLHSASTATTPAVAAVASAASFFFIRFLPGAENALVYL